MILADELEKLRKAYEAKTEANHAAEAAREAHKAQERVALKALAEARQESARPTGLGYTFTAVTDQEKGRISDRNVFFRWALEQEPSIEEFIQYLDLSSSNHEAHVREALYDAVMNLTILKVVERQAWLNAEVKRCHDDERPLPPGMDFEPVPYVSVSKA